MTFPDPARFLPDLAHEIRNPVSSIIAFAELVEMDPLSGGEFAKELISNAERIDRLMRDVCLLAQAQTMCAATERGLTDIVPTLRKDCAINPRIHLHLDTPVMQLAVDPNALSAALTPVFNNACEFSDPETPVEVTLSKNDTHAILTCRNIGAVIPEAMLPKLTEPFVKRRSPEAMLRHSGLGLTIASTIISGYSGAIDIISESNGEGQATNTVSVRLPLPA